MKINPSIRRLLKIICDVHLIKNNWIEQIDIKNDWNEKIEINY